MLPFQMQDQSQNPFATPTVDADADPHSSISRRTPFSTYIYVGIVFLLGAFAGGFIGSIPAVLLPIAVSVVVITFAALATGVFAANRMYRRLADIHQRKVAWEIQQSEWANGIG